MLFDVYAYVPPSHAPQIPISAKVLTYLAAPTTLTTIRCRPTPSTTLAAQPNSLSASVNSISTCLGLVSTSPLVLVLAAHAPSRRLALASSVVDQLQPRSRRRRLATRQRLLQRLLRLPRLQVKQTSAGHRKENRVAGEMMRRK
jgi:hypothetical protein